ncbi:reverse transcriptase domain-containing protein [Tanacetum coccineum]
MNFMIVRSPSPYNDIIGRPRIRKIQSVPSTTHGMLKFLVNGGVVTIGSIILTPNECATITATSKDSMKKIKGGLNKLKVAIHHDFPDQEVALGGTLSIEGRMALCALLKRNLDIFAWQPSDMTGAPEQAKAIQAEVQKLVKAGIMREVYYHDWLSNPVMVKKHDGSWRMCVDFTSLNKACPQDCYPLLEIDWKIQLAEIDEEKMAFHTPHGVYCYTKMLFGLKNARATYQRLVDKAFKKQVGQNLEVYVNDLVIKSHTKAELLRNIEETFRTLRKINMKLNPKKCTFGAVEGMFLEYMIGPKGIKPCPEKIEVVLQLPSPRTIKEVQSLNGKLAGLNRTPHVGGTNAKGRANNVRIHLPISGWRFLDDKKGLNPDASLFYFLVEKPEEASANMSQKEAPQEPWTLFMNGSSCIDGSGAGLILTSQDGAEFTYALRFQFTASNNEVRVNKSINSWDCVLGAQMGGNAMVRCKSVDSKLWQINFKVPVLMVLQEKSFQEQGGGGLLSRKKANLEDTQNRKPKVGHARWTTIRGRQSHAVQILLGNHAQGRTGYDTQVQRLPRPGKVKFLIVAMDYFTKWIDTKAVATISGGQVKNFVWDNIVCRFGLQGEIVSDNGKQFSDNPFKDWCEKLNITQRFASVKHPQSNGLVERANRSLGEKLDRGNPSRPLGSPYNDQVKQWGHSLLFDLRDGSRHTRGNRNANIQNRGSGYSA